MDEHISWELMQANNNVALIVPTSEARRLVPPTELRQLIGYQKMMV